MVSLHCCLPGGGPLPCTLVLVQRRYPAMFWLQGGPGGSSSVTPAAMSAMERDYRIAAARVSLTAELSVDAMISHIAQEC